MPAATEELDFKARCHRQALALVFIPPRAFTLSPMDATTAALVLRPWLNIAADWLISSIPPTTPTTATDAPLMAAILPV